MELLKGSIELSPNPEVKITEENLTTNIDFSFVMTKLLLIEGKKNFSFFNCPFNQFNLLRDSGHFMGILIS